MEYQAILDLFNELAESNDKQAKSTKVEPMARYFEGKKDAYTVAAQRIIRAMELHKLNEAIA